MTKPKPANPKAFGPLLGIPKFKEGTGLVAIARALRTTSPVLRPLLQLLGTKPRKFDALVRDTNAAADVGSQIMTTIQRFVDLFAPRNWAHFEWISSDAMKNAVAAGDVGDFALADQILTEAINSNIIDFALGRLLKVKHFQPRHELALLAAKDFHEGRYHAVVPVLLLLADGFGSDISGSNDSLFAKGSDFSAWDSVAGHPSVLPTILRALCVGRNETTSGSIESPFRHGILHGRDLGYANKIVAAKCWALLFALGDVALQYHEGKRLPPPPPEVPPPPTSVTQWLRHWGEKLQDVSAELNELQRQMDWKPQAVTDDQHPAMRVAREFLEAWQSKKWGLVALATGVDSARRNGLAGDLRRLLTGVELDAFQFESSKAWAVDGVDIKATLTCNRQVFKMTIALKSTKVLNQTAPTPTQRPTVAWRVENWQAVTQRAVLAAHRAEAIGNIDED